MGGEVLHLSPTYQTQIKKTMNTKQLEERLEIIENLLLSQKNVLIFDEAVKFTGLSRSYLYKLTSSQKIPHYKPNGKMLYFDRKEIEDWMKQNKVISTDEIEEMADNYLAGI